MTLQLEQHRHASRRVVVVVDHQDAQAPLVLVVFVVLHGALLGLPEFVRGDLRRVETFASSRMQPAGALHGVDGGLARDDGPAHGHGSIVGAALGAALIVEERFEDH